MKTTRNEIRQPIREHVFRSIADDETEDSADREKLQHAVNRFESEFNYPDNQKRYPNNQQRFIEYLLGLPFSFEYYYYKQREFLKGLGLDRVDSFDDQKVSDLYYNLIYREFAYLCRFHNIKFPKS